MTIIKLTTLFILLQSSIANDVIDFQQCNRQCRFQFGFYDRDITGIRVGVLNNPNKLGRHCNCYKNDTKIGNVLRSTLKPWDTEEFWCGTGGNSSTNQGFNTTFVCVQDPTSFNNIKTTTFTKAKKNNQSIIHCGKCSACSRPSDVRVLYNTRHTITTDMTRCAAKFAKPKIFGGDPSLQDLKKCLRLANITFDDTIKWNTSTNQGNGPTCMECWTDNIQCDSTQCNTNPSCIEKFINPNNTGAFSGCLKCDEQHCGSNFIRCAGANRRSSGIISDIQRVGEEVCTKGWYWNCSQCHSKCFKNDVACNNECEKMNSCRGPETITAPIAAALPSALPSASPSPPSITTTLPQCQYDRPVVLSVDRRYLYMAKCNANDLAQQWHGDTLTSSSRSKNQNKKNKNSINATNAAKNTASTIWNGFWKASSCLSTSLNEPMSIATPCDGALFLYNATNQTVSVVQESPGTIRGKGEGTCMDIDGGSRCNVIDLWSCHPSTNKDYTHQQWSYDIKTYSLKSMNTCGSELCLSLNQTLLAPYVATPCVWPNLLPNAAIASTTTTDSITTSTTSTPNTNVNIGPPMQSLLFNRGLAIIDNITTIPEYGADTFYPSEGLNGNLYSGFDDGGIQGVSVTSFSTDGKGTTTGSAIVTGANRNQGMQEYDSWKNLSVVAVGGAVVENAYPMTGRYTSANLYINGTWWIGSYGGSEGDKNCEMGKAIPQLCKLGPFVGFRYSIDEGQTWNEGIDTTGTPLSTAVGLFGDTPDSNIKFGAPHVVDYGPEHNLSLDNKIYMVAMGCLAKSSHDSSYNCSWISGDAIFVARASNINAMQPNTLNDRNNWEYSVGNTGTWTKELKKAKPIYEWPGRVGTTTATYWKERHQYLYCVTTPTRMPSTVSTYDTYVMLSDDLIGTNGFQRITYMPKFGQEIYFVSIPSIWLNNTHGVMTFSANFACGDGFCHSNIKGASYGANLLPIEFLE